MNNTGGALSENGDTTKHLVRCDSTCMCGTPGRQLTGVRYQRVTQYITHEHGKTHITTVENSTR